MRVFFLILLILPIAEIFVLIKVGQTIGFLQTLGVLVLMAILGAWFLRQQSFKTMMRAGKRMQAGQLPARELVEGVLISIGGFMLLLPGFITDAFALILLLPPTRHAVLAFLIAKGRLAAFNSGPGAFVFSRFGGGFPPQSGPGRRDIYEGEFTREEGPKRPLGGPKGPSEP